MTHQNQRKDLVSKLRHYTKRLLLRRLRRQLVSRPAYQLRQPVTLYHLLKYLKAQELQYQNQVYQVRLQDLGQFPAHEQIQGDARLTLC